METFTSVLPNILVLFPLTAASLLRTLSTIIRDHKMPMEENYN